MARVPARYCRVSLRPPPSLGAFHKPLYFRGLFVYLLLRTPVADGKRGVTVAESVGKLYKRVVATCENYTN
jgi:hypothetical protein